jgi:hypothetical protein
MSHQVPSKFISQAAELGEGEEDNLPSCSIEEALQHQDLFINRTLTALALHILWNIFRIGSIAHAGCFLNLQTLEARPIPLSGRKPDGAGT